MEQLTCRKCGFSLAESSTAVNYPSDDIAFHSCPSCGYIFPEAVVLTRPTTNEAQDSGSTHVTHQKLED